MDQNYGFVGLNIYYAEYAEMFRYDTFNQIKSNINLRDEIYSGKPSDIQGRKGCHFAFT